MINKNGIEEYAVGYPNASSDYQKTKWNKYEGEQIVKQRIQDALKEKGLSASHFSVKMMETGDYQKVTRIYAGGYMFSGGRGRSNKSFIQSKKNESIDLVRATDFIMEKEKELEADNQMYQAKRVREEDSHAEATKINDEFGLSYGNLHCERTSGYNADSSQVVVTFKKQCSPDEARELVRLLKQFA